MKFLMGLLAALFMVGVAQATGKAGPMIMVQDAEDAKGYFWRMAMHSKVTLDTTMATEAGDVKGPAIIAEVTKLENKICTVTYTMAGHSSETFMASKDGYFCYGLMKDGAFDPKMRLFKYDAKVGDTWSGWAAKEEGQPEVTVKYVGNEEVKVPAGTYKDVIHVQAVVTDGPTLDYYFAAKMGMVKMTFSVDGEVHRRLEMSAFVDGALVDPKK